MEAKRSPHQNGLGMALMTLLLWLSLHHSNPSAARSGPRGSQVPQRPGPLLCVSIPGNTVEAPNVPKRPGVCTSDAHRLAQLRTRPSFSTPRTGGRNSVSSIVTPWPARSSPSSASISATVASASMTREASTTTQCCGRLLAHAGSNSILEPVSVREEQQTVDSHEDLVRRDEISMTDPTVGRRGGRDHHGPGPARALGTQDGEAQHARGDPGGTGSRR